jgi:hypothetical protein
MRARWNDGNPLHSARTSECLRGRTTGGLVRKKASEVGGPASEAMPVIDKQFHSARTSERVRGGTTEIRCIASERANARAMARRVDLV